ncbi:malectin domain-containing carbohydrate-binding protein [Dyadobacter sandarakinus]|uniref:DNRLRE domain-containing protein n=1 Tax=Dyadobacter sandarakinus TaxID=2747268 RepID=A0ABX7IA07_9BACT|nr:malectin domain-containing carbohydrate-binding protein [Dyadobacter sandarakinus]QRR01998.1 DNRLRE domain-containing protein [Dyadobacter sandarakinus]
MIRFYSTFHLLSPAFIPLLRRLTVVAVLLLTITGVQAQWTRKADEIAKRAEGNNVVYQGKLYVFGGFADNPVIEKTNEVYDIARDSWASIARFPAGKEITHQGVVLVDNKVWHIGGRSVDAHGPVSSQVIIYDIATNTWSNGPELIDPSTGKAFPIGGGGYALVGRTIHVFGGFGPVICEDQSKLHLTIDVDKYLASPSTVTWENKLAPMPEPRNHISYVTLGGKIYALGGQFKHDCLALDQPICHVYDPATDAWTRLTDLPIVRSHAEASTFAVDGKIFLTAGQGVNDRTQNTVYQFNPQANNGLGSWSNLTAYRLPGSFLGLSAKLVGSSFIITNGALDSYANERKETYIAQVPRTPARTLGFSVPCFSEQLAPEQKSVLKNLLYVIEDPTNYTLTSNAGWLTVTKNKQGSVNLNGVETEVTINTAGLEPGQYSGIITAIGSQPGSLATFCVNVEVSDEETVNAIRINSGGQTFNASGNRTFTADQYYGGIDRTGTPFTGDILNTTDDALYRTERSSEAFSYNIPVRNGAMNVVLHFAEIWYGAPDRAAGGKGKRMFNVDIEGTRKLTDYDIYDEAGGALKPIQEIFPVTVTDGILNINFTTGKANLPKISAIEVIPQELTNTAPVLGVIGNKSVVAGQKLTFNAVASDEDGQALVFSLVNAPAGASIQQATGAFAWTPTVPGKYTFAVKVTDSGSPALSDQEQITVTVNNASTAKAIRINAGGANFTAADGRIFMEDQYFTGINRVSTLPGGNDILNTTDDVLYRTERSSNAFGYDIPVVNGTVNVILHFAEIWFGIPNRGQGGEGSRLFNVDIENTRKLTSYDIFAEAGGALRAVQETFTVNVTDGELNIDFTAIANLPSLAAIEVIPQTAVPSSSMTLMPVADAFVRSGNYANTNSGSNNALNVKSGSGNSNDRTTYLKFSLADVGLVNSAKLRLYGRNTENADNVSLTAFSVTTDSWTEDGITWNNAPAAAAALGNMDVNNQYKYYELDVTAFVSAQQAGDKTVSILFRNPDSQNRNLEFYSKEKGTYPPQLIIETATEATLARMSAEKLPAEKKGHSNAASLVYPNPAKGTLHVSLSDNHQGNVKLNLVSGMGTIIPLGSIMRETNKTKASVDLSGKLLPPGLYVLEMQSSGFTEAIKLLITE